MQERLSYVESLDTVKGGYNALPADAAAAIRNVVEEASSL